MKKSAFLACLLFFAACASPETAPEQADNAPIPEVALDADGNLITPETAGETENSKDAKKEDEITACREENANISLQLESSETKLQNCEADLAELKTTKCSEMADVAGIPPQFAEYVKRGILSETQKEYPFSCDQMGPFFRKSWFEDFSNKLLAQKIHFANGYLETTDLLGGCESTKGKMVFFLGAERGEDLKFFLIKYDLGTREVIPAMMFDSVENAIVTKQGKREGAVINFIADDGRVLKYYYDANIVTAE